MTSVMASLVAAGFQLKGKKSEAEMEAELDQLRQQGEAPTPHPTDLETRFEESPLGGGFFYANEETPSKCTVFYLHGGAYLHDFSPFHWRFLEKLVEKTDAMVIAPAYRLVPFATWEDAFELIVPVYRDYVEQHPERKIVLMGDSAGGGLSLALTEQMKIDGVRMPDELVLMSPWVDVTMENPAIEAFLDIDPWLSMSLAKVCGRNWIGSIDLHDYHVSPINGDLKGIRNVTVLTGTKELLLPDTLKLYSLLDQDGTNELIVHEGMMHVYPLMPIPEAQAAREAIFEKVMR